MTTRKAIYIIITFFCLTFIIFFAIVSFTKISNFNRSVEATFKETRQHKLHASKVSFLDYKTKIVIDEQFVFKEDRPFVHLTFDDGPTDFTIEILNILEKYDVQATFFLLYGNILNYQTTVKSIKEKGHSIGCHGVTHRLTHFYKNATSPLNEMNKCNDTIKNISGGPTYLIRVPYGSYPHLSSTQKKNLEAASYIMWDWNVDSYDWKQTSENDLIYSVTQQIKKVHEHGEIPVILLHDLKITTESLPKLIESIKALGFDFKPITPEDLPVQF